MADFTLDTTKTNKKIDAKDIFPTAKIKTDKGYFDIMLKGDDYPGIDIEFIPNNTDNNDEKTLPRVVFELHPDDGLCLYVWADKNKEDYSQKIIFEQEN